MVNSVGGSVLSHQLPVRGNGLVTRYTIEAGWAAGGGLVFVLRIKNYETLLYTTEFLKNKHIFKDVEFPPLIGNS